MHIQWVKCSKRVTLTHHTPRKNTQSVHRRQRMKFIVRMRKCFQFGYYTLTKKITSAR